MNSEIGAILIWIAANSSYAPTDHHPNIAMVEPYTLCQLYGVFEERQCAQLKIKGIYNKGFTIYLRNDFDIGDLEDRSRLAHELVHWLQWQNGCDETSRCMGKLESEAYELQDKWRAQYGLAPKRDMFTMMMLEASCDA